MKVYIGRYPKKDNKERKVRVQIDDHDIWSMDATLAHIVLPMLKKLRETKSGAPYTDDEDVPDGLGLRSTEDPNATPYNDVNIYRRWDWIMDEMIFAFEKKMDDNWEEQFHPQGKPFDKDGYMAYQARITNGFRLFGKYYEGLWD